MTEDEIKDIIAGLGQQISALSIDLAVARARVNHLEREARERTDQE